MVSLHILQHYAQSTSPFFYIFLHSYQHIPRKTSHNLAKPFPKKGVSGPTCGSLQMSTHQGQVSPILPQEGVPGTPAPCWGAESHWHINLAYPGASNWEHPQFFHFKAWFIVWPFQTQTYCSLHEKKPAEFFTPFGFPKISTADTEHSEISYT